MAGMQEKMYPDLGPGGGDVNKVYRTTTTESIENVDDLKDWEHTVACCLPWAYVWFKDGCGFQCWLNTLLSSFPCTYCFAAWHACSFIETPPKEGSPSQVIAAHGKDIYRNMENPGPVMGVVVMKQPMLH